MGAKVEELQSRLLDALREIERLERMIKHGVCPHGHCSLCFAGENAAQRLVLVRRER